ncbi:proline dehydrogenase family protein [Gynurincola endophyticus]|uniref:proline dehydrogenase family protein n=1 Tax=Gynurincola endophyticus TaxID=2479004 RepID=UPI000F8EBD0C|nr:proline dehydrogenase family protein [Gynurincola endophyticus]
MSKISFDNTAYAFAYMSDKELKKAVQLYQMMGKPWLVKLGGVFAPALLKWKLPVKGIIRNTIYQQFVGGETLEATLPAVQKLAKYNVDCILDYGVEGGEGEANFDRATEEFIRVINFAANEKNIPFMSIKVTGFARFALLEKIHGQTPEIVAANGEVILAGLTEEELAEWNRVEERMERIAATASKAKVGVMVDAEETWIQYPVDALTMKMMKKYNQKDVILFNTIQLYRHDRLAFLQLSHTVAKENDFILGAKIVRGAYMEKERKRAAEMGYASPIQLTKEASDKDYNLAIEFCIEHLNRISVIVASHNENSSALAASLLDRKGIAHDHPHVHFSQLYGMSDNITFNLAKDGYKVSKYLPFGPIEDVIPYLLRRAQENSSIAGQTGRELQLLRKEMVRRKAAAGR